MAPENFAPILFNNDMTFKQYLDLGDFIKVEDDTALDHQYILNIEYKDTKTFEYGDYLVFPDIDLNWQLYKVCQPYYEYSTSGNSFTATCEHVLYILDDDRPINTVFEGETLENAITVCLVNSQFTATFNDTGLSTETVSREIEYKSPLSAIQFICNKVECEFKPRIIINSNPTTVDLYLDFYYSLGNDKGVLFETAYNADKIGVQFDDSNLATALEGTGTDQQGNVIDIYDIEWSVAAGDPLDKPVGQTYLEDLEATEIYGIPVMDGSGTKNAVFDFYSSQSKTPEALIWELYAQIQKRKAPLINYPMDLKLLESVFKNQKVRLGDTVHLTLKEESNIVFTGDVRVIRIIRDRLYSENDKLELGNVIPTLTDSVSKFTDKTIHLTENGKLPSSAIENDINYDQLDTFGYDNTDNGEYSSMGGGTGNKINSGSSYSTIAGGKDNEVTGDYDVISGGGEQNEIIGDYGVISGGRYNETNDDYASIGGGERNQANGAHSFVGGGEWNEANSPYSVVAGGYENQANSPYSVVVGGHENQANADYGTVCGGENNAANDTYSFVGGGEWCYADSTHSVVVGGYENYASGDYSITSGGYENQTNAKYDVIGGGKNNEVSLDYSNILGGENNHVASEYSSIIGGKDNEVNGDYAQVSGGVLNICNGNYATLGGGHSNEAYGDYSNIPGGYDNQTHAQYSSSYGKSADTYFEGQIAHALGCFSQRGDTQESRMVLRRQTTDDTIADVGFDDTSVNPLIPTGSVSWHIKYTVVARRTDVEGETKSWTIEGLVERVTAGVAFVGIPVKTVIAQTTSAAAWDINLIINTDDLVLQVTGEINKTINWVAKLETVEVVIAS